MKSSIRQSLIRLIESVDEDLLAVIYNILIRLIEKG